jgi:hypothetical protein
VARNKEGNIVGRKEEITDFLSTDPWSKNDAKRSGT